MQFCLGLPTFTRWFRIKLTLKCNFFANKYSFSHFSFSYVLSCSFASVVTLTAGSGTAATFFPMLLLSNNAKNGPAVSLSLRQSICQHLFHNWCSLNHLVFKQVWRKTFCSAVDCEIANARGGLTKPSLHQGGSK